MSIEQTRIDAMADILQEHDIDIPIEKIAAIAKDFAYHLDIEREIEMTPFRGSYSHKEECESCKQLRKEIGELNEDISIFKDSVKARRGASHVYVDRHNRTVMYEP